MILKTDLTLEKHVEVLRDRLIETRRDFHMHPELSGEEERTAGIVASRLKELGLEVTTDVGGHGVIGLLNGDFDGPVVAWRADMDAFPSEEALDKPYKSQVPGVKHVCGHDVHTTIGLGIAEVLAAKRDQLRGQVKFVFQPAEETAEGAKRVVEAGGLENPKPEAIFGLHVAPLPVGKIGSVSGTVLPGMTKFAVMFKENDFDESTIEEFLQNCFESLLALTSLNMPTNPLDLFTDSPAEEINPEESLIIAPYETIIDGEKTIGFQGIVRTFKETLRSKAKEDINQVLENTLAKFGLDYELEFPEKPSLPNVINDNELERDFRNTIQSVLTEEKDLLILNKAWPLNSEDFAIYQQYIPGVFYWLGVANPEQGIAGMPHTPDFDVDEECMVIGVKTMSKLILSYLD